MKPEEMRKFYQENMYGTWRDGERVTYELLGEDSANEMTGNAFAPIGGELVKICIEARERQADFIVHAYLPDKFQRENFRARHAGSTRLPGDRPDRGIPFLICMHPISPKDYLLEQGVAVFVIESNKIASDDRNHKGAFYEIYPYACSPAEQTGVLMAWAWGASKVLDAVYAGLNREFGLDEEASMVTGVSRFGKATAVCGAFDQRFRLTIPACSGAGGLALYDFVSEGRIYNLSDVGGPTLYTYGRNEPLDCLQSEAERGWFNDKFLDYLRPEDIPVEQSCLPVMAMDENRAYFIIAAYTGEDWVNAPAMWECYKKANGVYEQNGLSDHLALHFHLLGHAVLQEDAEAFLPYFDKIYYGMDTVEDMTPLKTTAFAGQEDWLQISDETRTLIEKYRARKGGAMTGVTLDFVREALDAKPERGDRLYRLEHSLRVALWGRRIAEGEGWEPEPLILACLLHDVGYADCRNDDEFGLHHFLSAAIAEAYLGAMEYDKEKAKSICIAIELHAANSPMQLPELFQKASPFELSVWDSDDLDRYDEMRLVMMARRDIGETTAEELITICKDRIRRSEESRGRTCGTETARRFWYDIIEEGIRLYDRILRQMETTREMEEYIKAEEQA